MPLRVLAVTQAQWGERIAANVARHALETWRVERWAAPRVLPPVVDDPEEFLPAALPPADLVLALGETGGLAQLLPAIVQLSGARAVIAPIDRGESLPAGLARQLATWLAELGVAVVFPRPFCTLTPRSYNRPPHVVEYDNALIRAFAERFGRPALRLTVDAERRISAATMERDAACGCARFVAAGLVGRAVDEAEQEAGMLHHHYPCLASMNQDAEYQDTLMHVSGHLLRETVKEQVAPYVTPPAYFQPQGHAGVPRSAENPEE